MDPFPWLSAIPAPVRDRWLATSARVMHREAGRRAETGGAPSQQPKAARVGGSPTVTLYACDGRVWPEFDIVRGHPMVNRGAAFGGFVPKTPAGALLLGALLRRGWCAVPGGAYSTCFPNVLASTTRRPTDDALRVLRWLGRSVSPHTFAALAPCWAAPEISPLGCRTEALVGLTELGVEGRAELTRVFRVGGVDAMVEAGRALGVRYGSPNRAVVVGSGA